MYDPFGVNGGNSGATGGATTTASPRYKGSATAKNAGRMYDPFNIGSVQAVANPANKTTQSTNTNTAPAASNKSQPKQNLFQKAGSFVNNNFVKPIVQTGEKVANTAGAGAVGVAGLAKAGGQLVAGDLKDTGRAGAQLLTGNIQGAKQSATTALATNATKANQTANQYDKKASSMLDKGVGGKGGYVNSTQAHSSGDGAKGYVNNFVKPVAQATTDIAPLVVPFGGATKGASVATKVLKGATSNAIVGGASTAANEALNGGVKARDVVNSAATSAVLGGLIPGVHEGAKAGIHAAGDHMPTALTKTDQTGITNLKTNSLLAANRTPTDVNAPSDITINGNYQPSNARVKTLMEANQKQQDALAAPAKAAEQQQATATKAAQDTQAQGQKIDRQIEIIQAKGKDNGTLSNVDQTKLQHLKEDKANLGGDNFSQLEKSNQQVIGNADKAIADSRAIQAEVSGGPKTAAASEAKPAPLQSDVVAPQPKPTATEPNAVPKSESLPKDTTVPPEQKANSEPATLKPYQTAHLPEINGYTHSSHLEKDYADMLRGQEQSVKGGQLVDTTHSTEAYGEGMHRISEHSKFYRDFYSEFKKAPTKADYLDEAKRQLANGTDAFGAGKDYKALLERESKPLPGTSVNAKAVQGTGETKTSKLALGVQAGAVKEKLAKSLGELPQYSQINMREQAKAATELIQNDEARAIRIATGKEPAPSNVLPESVFTAVELKAQATGDAELLRQLAHSSLVSEATTMGQRIRALGERNADSSVGNIQKIIDSRAKAFERKSGTTATKAVSTEIKQIRAAKATIPKQTKETFASFVDSLKC